MTDRIRIMLSAAVAMTAEEANAIGVPPGQLIEADLSRLRAMAADARPDLSETERGAIGFVLAGLEQHRLLSGDLSLPSGTTLAADLIEMADWPALRRDHDARGAGAAGAELVAARRPRAGHRGAAMTGRLSGRARQARRGALIAENGLGCALCGATMTPHKGHGWQTRGIPRNFATLDHIVPLSAGGGNDMGNLRLVCLECNAKRGAKWQ